MKVLLFFALGLMMLAAGCKDDNIINAPPDNYGIRGTIVDKSGKPLAGVRVYYFFNYYQLPNSNINPARFSDLNKPAETDSLFENRLFQNIPNPVFDQTYIRFSVEKKSLVELSIKYKNTEEVVYTKSDTLNYGLYQWYPGDISKSDNFENSIYKYSIKITSSNSIVFNDEKEMLLISTMNKPADISGEHGIYFFSSNKSFVGDTISECSIYSPDEITKWTVGNNIYLCFIKEGYKMEIRDFQLYPEILYTQDIILNREDQK